MPVPVVAAVVAVGSDELVVGVAVVETPEAGGVGVVLDVGGGADEVEVVGAGALVVVREVVVVLVGLLVPDSGSVYC